MFISERIVIRSSCCMAFGGIWSAECLNLSVREGERDCGRGAWGAVGQQSYQLWLKWSCYLMESNYGPSVHCYAVISETANPTGKNWIDSVCFEFGLLKMSLEGANYGPNKGTENRNRKLFTRLVLR